MNTWGELFRFYVMCCVFNTPFMIILLKKWGKTDTISQIAGLMTVLCGPVATACLIYDFTRKAIRWLSR